MKTNNNNETRRKRGGFPRILMYERHIFVLIPEFGRDIISRKNNNLYSVNGNYNCDNYFCFAVYRVTAVVRWSANVPVRGIWSESSAGVSDAVNLACPAFTSKWLTT